MEAILKLDEKFKILIWVPPQIKKRAPGVISTTVAGTFPSHSVRMEKSFNSRAQAKQFARSLAQMKNTQNSERFSFVRVPGIEPGPNPWQGLVLPLNHTRLYGYYTQKNKKENIICWCGQG